MDAEAAVVQQQAFGAGVAWAESLANSCNDETDDKDYQLGESRGFWRALANL